MVSRVIAVIGCGPQAQRRHIPALETFGEQAGATIGLVVDLAACESSIRDYFSDRPVQPRFLFLKPGWDDAEMFERLDIICREAMVDRVLVSTEPMSHKKYILWALERGLDVYCDKPLTAVDMRDRSLDHAACLISDFDEVLSAESRSAGMVTLNTPLRRHAGLESVREYLRSFIREYGVPVTHLAVRHYQGCWYLPDEYISQENHPYKYGFGKLMHSGFHHVDLLLSLLETSATLPWWRPDALRLATQHARPADVLRQFPPARQLEILGSGGQQNGYPVERADRYQSCGETDVVATMAAMQDQSVMATGSLELLNSTLSARSWITAPNEPPNSPDQVPHESTQVSVGPLLSIIISENRVPGGWPKDEQVTDFVVRYYRNAAVVGGRAFEQSEFLDSPGEMHRSAYRQVIEDWVCGRTPTVPLRRHQNGVTLISALYRSMLTQEAGLAGVASMPLVGWSQA